MSPCPLTPEALAEQSSRGPRYTSSPSATELAPLPAGRALRELASVRADARPICSIVTFATASASRRRSSTQPTEEIR